MKTTDAFPKPKTFPSEAGHWYKADGTPAYTMIGKNGKERSVTLRDARKATPHYVPGVTTFINSIAKPGLEAWKVKQAVMASLTLPQYAEEAEDDYVARIMKDAKEEAIAAAERGTKIHAWVQQGFEGDYEGLTDEQWEYYNVASKAIAKVCGIHDWKCEQSFATSWYGGKIDLICDDYVLDIKTKDVPLDGLKVYDEHKMQLMAYREGTNNKGKIGIVFVSTKDVSARVVLCDEDNDKYLRMFNLLVDYYYAKTGLCDADPDGR